MKIQMTHYNFTHTADLPDDVNDAEFIESVQHLIDALWGDNRITVNYTKDHSRLRESIDQLIEGDSE